MSPANPGDPEIDQDEQLRRLEEENRELRESLTLLEDLRGRLGGVTERLTMLSRLSQELNTLDLDKIADIAVKRIPAVVGARYASLFLYDYANNELILRAHNHPGEIAQSLSIKQHKNTVMGQVLREKKIVHIADFGEFERDHKVKLERTFADKYASMTCISAPLMAGNFTVGVLNFADKTDGTFFDEVNDLPIIEQLAHVLAMGIRNCKLFKEVQNQARTDGMTKLSNYRAFHERLRSEMHRSTRYSRPLGLLMIDIDFFKKINDTHGHQAGDRVLIEMATIIRNTLRNEDMPARYGGDEIAIILPETSAPGVLVVAQRLINLVRAHEFMFDGKRSAVTISMGVAHFRPELSITDYVAAADQALYAAKQAGKNQFQIAPAPEPPKT